MDTGIFDVEYLRSEMALDTDTIIQLKDIYATSIEDSSISLYTMFADFPIDLDAAYPIAHTLKGTALSVNDTFMASCAEKVCKLIKLNNDPNDQELMDAGQNLLTLASERLDYLHTLEIN